jgi:hypothetical protein
VNNSELEERISLATGDEERRMVARAMSDAAGGWPEINRLTREAARLQAEVARLRGCLADAIALVASLRAAAAVPVRKPACKAAVVTPAGKARRASA